jgi:trypsin
MINGGHRLTLCALSALFLISLAVPSLAQEEIKSFGRRIVGGEKADIRNHPWQVALNIKIGGQTYLCGGSIIGDQWVLTAAHCVERATKPSEVRVKAAVTNLSDGGWSEIVRIVIHEHYDRKTHEHDVALIKTAALSEGRVIPLVTADQRIPSSQPLEVTGWGATSEGGDESRHLLKATVPYTENVTCNALSAYNGMIKPDMLCAGYREGGVDSCQGDSGGPLVWRRPGAGPVLVGVVSWGEGCARKLQYGVYSRVSSYVDWIGRVVAQDRN